MMKVTLPFKYCTVNGQEFRAYPDGRLERRINGNWRLVDVVPGNRGYHAVRISGKSYLCHRIVYQAFNPDWDIDEQSSQIDHIDRNPCNNAISNLRIATRSENNRNRSGNTDRKYIGLPKNIVPIYMGNVNRWYWRVAVNVDGKPKTGHIFAGNGRIPDPLPPVPIDVIKMRDDFVKLHHGKFAN